MKQYDWGERRRPPESYQKYLYEILCLLLTGNHEDVFPVRYLNLEQNEDVPDANMGKQKIMKFKKLVNFICSRLLQTYWKGVADLLHSDSHLTFFAANSIK